MHTNPTTTAARPAGLLERLDRLTGELLARDGWSRERLLAYQAGRLRALLDARGQPLALVPRHPRRRRRRAGPWPSCPPCSKASLMDNFDQLVTDPRLRRADLEAHMAGPDPARSFLGRVPGADDLGHHRAPGHLRPHRGRGRRLDRRQHARRGCAPASGPRPGWPGSAPPAGCTSPGSSSPPCATPRCGPRGRGASPAPPDVSTATPLPELVAALNAYQPEALVGYPSVAGLLADEQLAGRLHIAPRGATFGAEPLTPNLRRRIRAAWGFEPVSLYAATESPVIASSTPKHAELEIAEDLVLVEVVDEHNRAVPPGTPGAKVLITNLVNFAQPLIRYELTDAVTLAEGPNPAGRPYRRIAAIEGRSAEVLHLPARGGGATAVHPSALGAAFAPVPEVRQYQFLYDGRGLQARVVLAPDAPAGTLDRLRRSLERAIEATGAVAPPVDVRPVTALQREPGPGHKLKLVKTVRPGP